MDGVDQEQIDAVIGLLNGCGLGAVLWTIIIGTWRLLA